MNLFKQSNLKQREFSCYFKRVSGYTFDVFVGNGWLNWSRVEFNPNGASTTVIAGIPRDREVISLINRRLTNFLGR